MRGFLLSWGQVSPEPVTAGARVRIHGGANGGDDVTGRSKEEAGSDVVGDDDPGASAFAADVYAKCREAVADQKFVAATISSRSERLGQYGDCVAELCEERRGCVSSLGTFLGDRRSRPMGSVRARACGHGGMQTGSTMLDERGAVAERRPEMSVNTTAVLTSHSTFLCRRAAT